MDEEGEEEDAVSDDEATPATSPAATEPTLQSIFAMSDDPDQPPMPFQRYNAMLVVLRNTLYMCDAAPSVPLDFRLTKLL